MPAPQVVELLPVVIMMLNRLAFVMVVWARKRIQRMPLAEDENDWVCADA